MKNGIEAISMESMKLHGNNFIKLYYNKFMHEAKFTLIDYDDIFNSISKDEEFAGKFGIVYCGKIREYTDAKAINAMVKSAIGK